jgi:hypothetical protein
MLLWSAHFCSVSTVGQRADEGKSLTLAFNCSAALNDLLGHAGLAAQCVLKLLAHISCDLQFMHPCIETDKAVAAFA